MREASPTKGRAAAAGRARRASRADALARALLLLVGCALMTACPLEGGDLVPVPRGDGASLATTDFEGDTLSVTREGVTLRARGLWSVADADTSVILEASNANAEPAAIDFGRAELARDDGKGRMSLRSVTRESGAGGAVTPLADRIAKLDSGGAGVFVLNFKMDSEDGRSGVPRDVNGQTITLRLPVEPRQGRAPAVEFVFGFRYAERRARR